MKIRWTRKAVNDLASVRHYIEKDKPDVANRIVLRIMDSIDSLPEYPKKGRMGRVLNTRELIITDTPYIVPYRIRQDIIEILRILHGSMKWPKKF